MKFYLTTIFSVFISLSLFSAIDPALEGKSGKTDKGNGVNAKANCSPSNTRLFMEFNDVRCLIEVGGLTWMNRQNSTASYEVPKGSRNHVIFAGSIWMGGLDVNGQLKLAAVRYRQGNDFWAGPLTITPNSGDYDPRYPVGFDAVRDFGEATITPATCIKYDEFFTMRKSEVINFALQFECDQNPECDEEFPITADALNRIEQWPAHGNLDLRQDYYLAPFYDYPTEDGVGDGIYNPADGDHPWYDDIIGRDDIECGMDRRVPLFGDETHWWVFNDKGNIHTETGADPIGMEIRAQAFSFATNDEINRMTFYNYEMINRSTQTLTETYFSVYCDADIGFPEDDYIGCDVFRGLGYAYNGTNFDPGFAGMPGYGDNPPAVGIDFFEGPYQDADGIDNPGPRIEEQPDGSFELVTPTLQEALALDGIVYSDLGMGYSDGIVDNERFGMRRFNYYNRSDCGPTGTHDPTAPAQYYNYMTGFWRDNSPLFFGGSGYTGSTGLTTQRTDYAYPNDSDPMWWATGGVDMGWNWSETDVDGNGTSNDLCDRRFLQTAGPFTLTPGAVNNLTIGVVYGRAFSGEPYESVMIVKRNDTKAQALFDNCFRIIDPPQAPVVEVVELDRELVLLLDNPFGNNVDESYAEEDDINIIPPEDGSEIDNVYRFEGYQIYQLKDFETDVADIDDVDNARLVAQCDIKNDITRIINFEFDEELGFSVPSIKVDGENRGIRHSFRILEDAFASGDTRLVNHKKYYYVAIAYAHNEFKPYNPDDPDLLDGQKLPYISSRLAADGSAISPVVGIPSTIAPRLGGTRTSFGYGDSPEITALDGQGNGSSVVELTNATEEFLIQPGNNNVDNPTFRRGKGPINVKVIDPLNIQEGYYRLDFKNYDNVDTASWVLNRYASKGDQTALESISSDRTIKSDNEQLIPDLGISVHINQTIHECPDGLNCPERERIAEPLEATISFVDTSKIWLSGVPHDNAFTPQNWIMSGDFSPDDEPGDGVNNPQCYADDPIADPRGWYDGLLGGIVTSGRLARYNGCGYNPVALPGSPIMTIANYGSINRNAQPSVFHPSVDIVFTDDKSKWTRCPVIELNNRQELSVNGGRPGLLRKSPSIDKEGRQAGDPGYNAAEGDLVSDQGMGWFPGYAIDVETGRRLNMAYCENSFLAGENGADMVWNPTHRMFNSIGSPLFGGQHTIYVLGGEFDDMPAYDEGKFTYENLAAENSASFRAVYRNLSWVMQPLLVPDEELLSTDARIRLRISKKYKDKVLSNANQGKPSYEWNIDGDAIERGSKDVLAEALRIINVVPNPYYAFSLYETDRLDNRAKITNLPERCKIRIYNTSGKLIRAFDKGSPISSLDWDLKNEEGIPIGSGVYLIHVDVPDVGERIVKFFAGMRQPDLENL